MKKQQTVLAIGVVLVASFAIGAMVYRSKADEQLDKTLEESPSVLVRPTAKTLGPPDAKVHIVEFLDPGCETCRAFHPFVKQLIEDNPGKVRLSIRYLPLHEGADTMVKILEAADKQGKYWETLVLMLESQPHWASHHHPQPDKIWPLLPHVGLDTAAIRRDMNAPEITAILEQDMADARALGIRKTPSFFVNGEPLRTFGYEPLRQLVDNAVSSSY
ncbi:MAG TPA: thioredoxin domain-containing protein [Kofleriaceae bacterium]|nr:thioredoxin domain-containing protein [Kofleriaceae bacterium]